MQKKTNTQNKWIRLTSWLLMVAILLVTPATLMAAPAEPDMPNISPSSYIPLLRNNVCGSTRDAGNPLGLQVYGSTGYSTPLFNEIQNTQSSWLRNGVDWSAVEPQELTPSRYNWGAADQVIRAAVQNCANMIITIAGTPDWATTGNQHSPYKTTYQSRFVEFTRALVERYDGDKIDDAPGGMVVNYWEFYNEPDGATSPSGGGWGNDPARYADMLKAVYPVVKEANPNAKVVFGGIAYDNFTSTGGLFVREFFDNVLDALEPDAGKYFDIMNVHYYPFSGHRTTWSKTNSSGLVEKINDLNLTMAAHGVTKPMMVTEIGWHSGGPDSNPSNEDFQARHVVQMAAQSMALDAVATIWWTLQDLDGYPWKTGILRPDNSIKVSYVVYQETVRRLGNATFVKVVMPATEDNDLEIYEFREAGTNRTMYTAWLNPIAPFNAAHAQTFDDSVTQTWQVPGSNATIYAKDGSVMQTINDGTDGTTDGQITVAVPRSPIYIVIN
jgi:hypothetical protein